jgi:hypothetical protein
VTRRPLAAIAAALALAALPARSLEGNAVLGGGYMQSSTWAPGTAERVPTWIWVAGGEFRASPLGPGLLQLDGGVQYDASRTRVPDAPSSTDGVTYRLHSSLLGDYVPTDLYASRTSNDFALTTTATLAGNTLVDAYGGVVTYQLGSGALLRASASRSDQTTRPLTGDEYRLQTNRAGLLASQNLETLDYRLGYDTTWSDGSFADTQFQQHAIVFDANANLSRQDRLQLLAQYSLREPRSQSALNPRFDSELVRAGATLGVGERWGSYPTYSYSHSLVEILGAPAQEQTSHGLTYLLNHRRSAELQLTGLATASYALVRAGPTVVEATGAQAGGGFNWLRGKPEELTTQLSATATLGGLQAPGGGLQPGYGLTGAGLVAKPFAAWTASAEYRLNFEHNLNAVEGTGFGHQVVLGAESSALRTLTLTTRLTASSNRREIVLLGTSLDRSVAVGASAAWRRTSIDLSAGLSDGLAPTLRGLGVADGLFFGTTFDAHSRYVTLQAAHAATRQLRIALLGRYLVAEAPARPSQYEAAGSVVVAYDVGQFTFRLEDRLAQGGSGGGWTRTNLVFARVERRFALGF